MYGRMTLNRPSTMSAGGQVQMPNRPPRLQTRASSRAASSGRAMTPNVEVTISKASSGKSSCSASMSAASSFAASMTPEPDIDANDVGAATLDAPGGPTGTGRHINAGLARLGRDPGYKVLDCIQDIFAHPVVGEAAGTPGRCGFFIVG
jgi:hypothetical protein